MGCYLIPMITAIAVYIMRRNKTLPNTKHNLWLNQLFLGGAIFGVIDHLWNGELFLFGNNLFLDLALGFVISLVIIAVWRLMVWVDSNYLEKTQKQTI